MQLILLLNIWIPTGAAPVAQPDRSVTPVSYTSRLAQVNSGYAEAAETLTAGTFVHFNSSGKLVKAQANAGHTLKCQAMVLEDAAIGQFPKYILSGVTTLFGGIGAGTYYFLSTTSGMFTTAPAGGNAIQYLGFGISSGQFYFNPELRHS